MKLCFFDIAGHFFHIGFDFLDVLGRLLFGVPTGFHLVEILFLLGKLGSQFFKSLFRELIVLFFKGHFLNFKLHDIASEVIQLARHGIDFSTDHGAGFIHKVNGLIR